VAEVIKLIEAEKSEINSKNAEKDRKVKPTKEALEAFRIDWSKEYCLKNDVENIDHGWKKAAQSKFKLSPKTLNLILK
jgi:hypothetical protein